MKEYFKLVKSHKKKLRKEQGSVPLAEHFKLIVVAIIVFIIFKIIFF